MSGVHHVKTEMPWMQLKVMVNFAIIEISIQGSKLLASSGRGYLASTECG